MGAVVSLDRLAAVLGMMGSDHDGEVLSAARMAEKLRREAGVTWHELLIPTEPPARASYTAPEPPGWWDMVEACRARPDRLTDWERQFIDVLAGYTHEPSEKQMRVLERLADKASR